ncbi:potassium transporter TrkA [Halogeometricum borinquense]|uniref:Potassium transporter TrkA n=1 Tax=Halogeometricum borinquense TaxID=60847 RepID=A0A482T946_9EURY|nr:TrkA C-terminal domain-containing protein [Halogeometricum borinquense]RYJ14414.1 potassium transporter TrkA [Halogeometricum borinquense]
MSLPLQLDSVLRLVGGLLQEIPLVVGLAALSAGLSATAAIVYRWYTRELIPRWLAALFGGSSAALYLNAVGLLRTTTERSTEVFDPATVLLNSTILLAALVSSPVGRSVGDRIATDVFAVAGARSIDAEVSRIVRTVGRVTAVELPEEASEIADIDGYDPVPVDRKAEMAGKRLLFPRRLTREALTDRLVTRIKEDYGVGHVDAELDDAGNVSYLALGRRIAGLGPTMPPGVAAVAVHADPGAGASAGDAVQLWRTGEDGTPERVVGAELRATADDVATVIVDESDAQQLDYEEPYRLVTLPSDPGAEHEFTSLLRSADETMETVPVETGSELVGETLRSLDATVIAVRPSVGAVETIPSRSRELAAGDILFLVARPETIRRIARAATAPEGKSAEMDERGEVAGTDLSDDD